jgi:hypothetical protein
MMVFRRLVGPEHFCQYYSMLLMKLSRCFDAVPKSRVLEIVVSSFSGIDFKVRQKARGHGSGMG